MGTPSEICLLIVSLQVKGLLRQAADREREQEKEKVIFIVIRSSQNYDHHQDHQLYYHHHLDHHQENLKRQLKLILEIDPKTPGEALAKELRQVSKH